MMWTRLCGVFRCVPIKLGVVALVGPTRKPTIPTRMSTMPKIVAIVFAMTLVSPPWEERLDKRRGSARALNGSGGPTSGHERPCGRILQRSVRLQAANFRPPAPAAREKRPALRGPVGGCYTRRASAAGAPKTLRPAPWREGRGSSEASACVRRKAAGGRTEEAMALPAEPKRITPGEAWALVEEGPG